MSSLLAPMFGSKDWGWGDARQHKQWKVQLVYSDAQLGNSGPQQVALQPLHDRHSQAPAPNGRPRCSSGAIFIVTRLWIGSGVPHNDLGREPQPGR